MACIGYISNTSHFFYIRFFWSSLSATAPLYCFIHSRNDVCSEFNLEFHFLFFGLDMIAVPGDTDAATISAIIADEAAIGVVNTKTTAVRIIPVEGKNVGDEVEYGGLLGSAPVMPVNKYSSKDFIARGGRIPAPMHSLKN